MTTNPITTRYRAASARGLVQSVDFSTVAGKNYTFFQLYDQAGLDEIRTLMTAAPIAQEVIAITHIDGKPMLVMHNHASPFTILEALKARGEILAPVQQKKSFDAWKVRSILGFGGQGLQLVSSFLRPSRQVDTSVLVFATSNLAANSINLIYKSEKVEDKHQLRYLKQRVNRELSPHLKATEAPISIDDHRTKLRKTGPEDRPLDEARGFMRRHSVQIGELGLRCLGAIGLAFPARYWKAGWQKRTIPQMDSSTLRRYTGLSSLAGKGIAFTSKIEDPYNPKPQTFFDSLREKYTFLAGGLIEVTSFSALAYDCFFNSSGTDANIKRGLLINGKHHRDWLGGIGATMFVLGYIVRSWAKFGERQVDMTELYAHASDMLAETPPDKIPQLLANTAASLSEHFGKPEKLGFSTIYSNLLNDLSKYHAQVIEPGAPIGQPSHSAKVLAHPRIADRVIKRDTPSTYVTSAHIEQGTTCVPMAVTGR